MGAIKLTTINNFIHFYIGVFDTDKCMINWGDGNEDEYVPVREENEDGEVWYEIIPEHTYTDGKSSHTVTIRGKIKGCDMSGCEVTSIDATKCPALEGLECYINQLTSLDVSKNTALRRLRCWDNQFSASAMNKIYNDLPVVKDGMLACDKLGDYSIAKNKGWEIF